MDFGGTELLFSPGVPHGYTDELGYVVMPRIAQGHEVFVHPSDVLGPPLKEHLSFLIDAQATVLYVDGPMTHMPENYPPEHTKRSISHLLRILRTTDVRTLILDHHILRDRDWRSRMGPVFEAGEENHAPGFAPPRLPRETAHQPAADPGQVFRDGTNPEKIKGRGASGRWEGVRAPPPR